MIHIIKKVLWLMFLMPCITLAQEIDSLAMDSLAMDSLAIDSLEEEPPKYYGGIYIIGELTNEPSTPQRNLVGHYGIGFQYNRWALDFSVSEFLGTYQFLLIFPSVFELKYRYGGPELSFAFYNQSDINLFLSTGYFRGDVVWQRLNPREDFLRDEFSLYKVGLVGEYNRLRFFKPRVSVGYQRMNEIDLSNVSGEDFTGFFIGLGVRIGYFNQ